MGIQADRIALTQHFLDNWEGPRVVHDNSPAQAPSEKETWVRFSVIAGASFHDAGSSQTGLSLQQGRVWLQVFVPTQSGVGAAHTLMESFGEMFRHQRLDDNQIQLKMPDYGSEPNTQDGYSMWTVSVPYESRRRYA